VWSQHGMKRRQHSARSHFSNSRDKQPMKSLCCIRTLGSSVRHCSRVPAPANDTLPYQPDAVCFDVSSSTHDPKQLPQARAARPHHISSFLNLIVDRSPCVAPRGGRQQRRIILLHRTAFPTHRERVSVCGCVSVGVSAPPKTTGACEGRACERKVAEPAYCKVR
jgi:hypothetical protein